MNRFLLFLLCFGLIVGIAAAREEAQLMSVDSSDGTALKVWVMHPSAMTKLAQSRPVVIALHGCGGLYATVGSRKGKINARHDGMAQYLLSQGYSVVLPDSFTTRGEQSLCHQKLSARKIKQAHRRMDVNGVLEWLSLQTWVDSKQIALLGWSHGGSAVLAATDANHPSVSSRRVQPTAAIAFYPGCSDALRTDYRPQVPLFMLLAELDDWTPPAPCIALGDRVNAKVIVYPNSHHGFDNPVGSVQLLADVPNGVHPGQGVHAGRNPETGPQSWSAVVEFLKAAWAPH